jgi:Protein of unknown function (DUF1236)
MQTHEEALEMFNRFMITAATAALIAGTGFAYAQGTGTSREAPASPSSAPSSQSPSPSHEGGAGMKSSQSEEKMQPHGAKGQQAQDMKPGARDEKSAQENTKGERTKSTQNEKGAANKDMKDERGAAGKDMKDERGAAGKDMKDERGAAGKDMKAEGREDRGNMKAEGREGRNQTVGQAGAGARLTTEQRTRITSVIREQHVAPVNNVNFAISIGTRVPREVGFHPLPAEIVTIYPEWRGYEFFLVRDQIVVVDPRTLEIVAVLEA